ncbi:hypothetical protein ACIQGT_40070 [Streptomyces sp. NPDC093108]|uniref:hypothetical protein n=1 Tax=Streptomyces sp. NPDC093108 TaxID=3366030 RepID=UPI003800D662
MTTPRPRPASVTARIEDTPAPPPHSHQETLVTGPQLDLDAITAMPRAEDIPVLAAEVRRLRTEPAAPAAPGSLRTAYIAALDEAHHTHPCPVTGRPYWTGCFHPDGQGASCHSRRRADAVLAVRDTELERLRAQNRHLIGQLAEKATHSDDDHALLGFPGAVGTVDLAAADNPTQLRWGLGDVLWGDDDTVTVLLSGLQGEPYWLELGEERAAALRQDLAGPGQDETADGLSTDLAESQQVVDEHNNAQ